MRGGNWKRLELAVFALIAFGTVNMGEAQKSASNFSSAIPKVWDDEALASLEIPLAAPEASAVHVSSDYYYRIPVRTIYKSYPVYAPGREPAGYMEWLKQQEPEIAFNPAQLKTRQEWVQAGQTVFDAPIGFGGNFKVSQVRDPAWYERNGVPVAKDGTMPFSRYVIRKKGEVEIGGGACLMCHSRVMPDGSVVKGAQGNFPADRVLAFNMRAQAAQATDSAKHLENIRSGQLIFYSVPWLQSDPHARLARMSIDEIAAAYEAIPPGVTTRVNSSLFFPAQVPDLIGLRDRKHLDRTGLVRQRSIADLMRYAALVQGANSFDRYGEFRLVEKLPDPSRLSRYGDEQLYALALYLYSLEPPHNPNKFDALAKRGRRIFERESCAGCHAPPLYSNNRLSPVDGFKVADEHRKQFDTVQVCVGTDSDLALKTRKGTGYYKIPSLKGVWYRGPFEHNGSVATLEDWFDPRRTSENYVPTGFVGFGRTTRAVKGHPFGLKLSVEDRKALIAFLKTL
jgi:hypothetical protein